MTRPVILYRDFDIEPAEKKAMRDNFVTYDLRNEILEGDLVVGRFSVLPFYRELELDIAYQGGQLINSWQQHSFVADIGKWYPVLRQYTPETWSMQVGTDSLPDNCSFVLKGATNSIKRLWNTHMFARTKSDIADVYGRLLDDTMVGQQEIFVRRYVPLRKLGEAVNGMPITEEYRFFVCYGEVISEGFYWSSNVGDIEVPKIQEQTRRFVSHIANLLADHCNFLTIDVGITEEGHPIVIELNDGQMAGLSENDPVGLYKRLRACIDEYHETHTN